MSLPYIKLMKGDYLRGGFNAHRPDIRCGLGGVSATNRDGGKSISAERKGSLMSDSEIDVHPVVLPLDRDGRDDDAPEGYPAINEDGTIPIVDGDTIYIRQYYCSCGQGCGGCRISSFPHPIDGKRFHWENAEAEASPR